MDNNGLGQWLLILVLFWIWWPLGAFFLIRKLWKYYKQQKAEGSGTRKRSPRRKKVDAFVRRLTGKRRIQIAVGALLSVVGILIMTPPFDAALFITGLLMVIPGCLLLVNSMRIRAMLDLYSRCSAIIGKRSAISLDELASVSGLESAKLVARLENLLSANAMPGAYIDYSRSLLVLSADGIEDNTLWQQRTPQTGQVKVEQDESAYSRKDTYIAKIRALNDDIDDEELSKKIDRIERSVTKMFEAVERDPEKRPELERFLSYYLPTTLKILDAYANFEDSTAQGEKIRRTMDDIESTVETLAVGFERQLDLMYEDDTIDIETDLRVLESMLAKDGLSDAGSISPLMNSSRAAEPEYNPEAEE